MERVEIAPLKLSLESWMERVITSLQDFIQPEGTKPNILLGWQRIKLQAVALLGGEGHFCVGIGQNPYQKRTVLDTDLQKVQITQVGPGHEHEGWTKILQNSVSQKDVVFDI